MVKLHSFLVAVYMLGGLALIVTTPFAALTGSVMNSPGTTLQVQALHGSADASIVPTDTSVEATNRANASRQLLFGILMFTLGGFVHAFAIAHGDRPVKVTVKKKKPALLYWLEMKV